MTFTLNNLFTKELPADSNSDNSPRQVYHACFSYVLPKTPSNPYLIHTATDVARQIGLTKDDIEQ